MKEVIDTVSVALASGEVEELGGAVMQEVNLSLIHISEPTRRS